MKAKVAMFPLVFDENISDGALKYWRTSVSCAPLGGLGEWFKPAVLKTAEGKPSVSSNLTASARTLFNSE
jgi:hypothetical protein